VPVAVGAGHRPATTMAVHCGPLRRRSSITRATITPANATRSPRRTRSPTRHAQVAGARLNQVPNPSRRNPHSARGTGVPHDPRVPSLEAFGRRPRCLPRRLAMGRHPKPFTSAERLCSCKDLPLSVTIPDSAPQQVWLPGLSIGQDTEIVRLSEVRSAIFRRLASYCQSSAMLQCGQLLLYRFRSAAITRTIA
jgi:hypothetical protein